MISYGCFTQSSYEISLALCLFGPTLFVFRLSASDTYEQELSLAPTNRPGQSFGTITPTRNLPSIATGSQSPRSRAASVRAMAELLFSTFNSNLAS